MLRINVRRSASAVVKYYSGMAGMQEVLRPGEHKGTWHGKAAIALGVEGTAERADFEALANNIDPATKERLTLRTKSNRRVGYDLDFHPPKSVSVAYAVSGDERIRPAMERAVEKIMGQMEQAARTRVRREGIDEDRTTGNLVWASFTHELGRPVGGIPDPHLHVHCFVFNATYDEIEHEWKALQFGHVVRNAPVYEALFQRELAHEMELLGYTVDWKGSRFELAEVPQETIEKFSRRSQAIAAENLSMGITDPKAQSQTGAKTREPKLAQQINVQELLANWESRLPATEREHLKHIPVEALRAIETQRASGKPYRPVPDDPALIPKAIAYAKAHAFERLSVVDEMLFFATAMRMGGRIDPLALREAIKYDPTLLKRESNGRTVLTTPEVLQEEQRVVRWVKAGHGTQPPLGTVHAIDPPAGTDASTDEQTRALRKILSSRDRVTGIIGKPGTGKTTLMRSAIAAIEAGNPDRKVIVLAPTAETGRGTLREAGFPEADTVEHLLSSPKMHAKAQGAAWWIDEAGLLSLRDLSRITELAERLDARLILSGDTQQHRSVRRGDALRILLDHAELDVARLGMIRRQSGIYREAVNHLSEHRMEEAFHLFDQMGALVEIDGPERHQILASEYLQALHEGATALIVSPTHSEGRAVTGLVRKAMKASGHLSQERFLPVMTRVDLYEADMPHGNRYQRGWVVEFVKRGPRFDKGERFQIKAVTEDGELLVHDGRGLQLTIDPEEHWREFQVFEPGTLPIAVGDRLRFTKNGFTIDGKAFHNGSLYTVQAFTTDGDLILDRGLIVSQHFCHLTHGYVTTSYAAQSKTIDRVFVAEASDSFPAASREQFYVSVSRGRTSVRIYTDDKEALFEAIRQSSQRTAAMDLEEEERAAVAPQVPQPQLTMPAPAVRLALGQVGQRAPTRLAEAQRQIVERDEVAIETEK